MILLSLVRLYVKVKFPYLIFWTTECMKKQVLQKQNGKVFDRLFFPRNPFSVLTAAKIREVPQYSLPSESDIKISKESTVVENTLQNSS